MSSPARSFVVKRFPLGNFITGWVRRPDRFCLPCEESCEYFAGPGECLKTVPGLRCQRLWEGRLRHLSLRRGLSSRAQRAALGKQVGLESGGWPRRAWRLVLTVPRVLSLGRGDGASDAPEGTRHPKAHNLTGLVDGRQLWPKRIRNGVVAGSGDALAPQGLAPLRASAERVGGAYDVAAARGRPRHVVHGPGVGRVPM